MVAQHCRRGALSTLPRRFLGYGIFVLVMEIAGATTTLLYGINMIWHPVNAPVPEDPANPGLPKARVAWGLLPAAPRQGPHACMRGPP